MNRRKKARSRWIVSPLLFAPCRCPVGMPSGSCMTCRRWARHARTVAARRRLFARLLGKGA